MTAEEVRRRIEPLLDPAAFVPIALDLSTGARVFIDLPGQAELKNDRVVITRRRNPVPEQYGYDVIDRITPVDQFPAEPGGMSYAEFDRSITSLFLAEPFRPFTVELKSGTAVEITRRPEIGRMFRYLWFRPNGVPEKVVTFDKVARLVPREGSVSR